MRIPNDAVVLEIDDFCYRVFPWIIEVFEISSYYFYKVIEVLVRVEDGLSRDVVKHLNHVSFHDSSAQLFPAVCFLIDLSLPTVCDRIFM